MPNRYDLADELVRRYSLEKIDGYAPQFLLDMDPGGQWVALQGHQENAAVYDLVTGKIVWQPEGLSALCWLPGGRTALLTRKVSKMWPVKLEGPHRYSTPQVYKMHSLERWSWPEKQRRDGCLIAFPTGWPVYVTASPKGDLAVFQWQEQDSSGIEVFELTADEVRQRKELRYRAQTTLVECPVFSPDGRYVALACTIPFWWGPDLDNDDDDYLSPGGRFLVGEVVVLDTAEMVYRSLPVYEELPPGWSPCPSDISPPECCMMEEPKFLDETHVSVRLTTGGEWLLSFAS
jgi:hypothetical protein